MIGRAHIKNRLRNGEVLKWGTLRICEPAIAEMMAIAGIDILVIDYAHYPFNEEKLCNIIRAADIYNTACIFRLNSIDRDMISKALDCGASGIQLCMVSSYEEARALVDAVKFSPAGTRTLCPITRGAGYGLSGLGFEDYVRVSNEETLVVAQIETKEGIESLDKILTIPEIDFFCGGKADLSASYGLSGQVDHPLIQKITEEFRTKVKAAGKHLVIKGNDAEEIAKLRSEGVQVIGISSDQQMFMAELTRQLAGF